MGRGDLGPEIGRADLCARLDWDGKAGQMMRWFRKVTVEGRVLGILRLQEDPKRWAEEVWTGKAWEPTDLVMRALVGGEATVDEIDQAEARSLYPAAF